MAVETSALCATADRCAADWLHEDLLTDWIPDAVGGAGLQRAGLPADEFGGRLRVATRTGGRLVPVPSLEFRAWALARTEQALVELERGLGAWVYGYRDAVTSYRTEWARLAADQTRLQSKQPICLRLDVERFFESIDVAALTALLPSKVSDVILASERLFEQPLIPGHRWSRRVANVALSHLDGSILQRADGQIQRWQDDYWIFANTESEAMELAQQLREALRVAGLHLSASKFGLAPKRLTEYRLDSSSAPAAVDDALRDGDISKLKYLMRWFAENGISEPLPRFGDVTRQSPVLFPRLAAWIAKCANAPGAAQALAAGLRTDDLWVQCRLTAAACHSERLSRLIESKVVERLAESGIPAARGLAARIQRMRGLTRVSASSRIDAVLKDWTDELLARNLPLVQTTL